MAVNKDKISEHIEYYTYGGYKSFKDALDPSEYKYVKKNMSKTSSNSLYRFEINKYTFSEQNLSVGKKFSFTDDLRSFSRSKTLSNEVYNSVNDIYTEEEMKNPIIFKTKGAVSSIDISKYNPETEYQQEEMVGGTFQVKSIEKVKLNNGVQANLVTIEQTSTEPISTRGTGSTKTGKTKKKDI